MNIYELTNNQLALLHRIEELDLDEQTISDTLEAEGFEGEIADKLDAYGLVAGEFSARANMRREEAKRMLALADADDKKANGLRDTIKLTFERLDMKDLNTRHFSMKIKLNPPRVDVFGEVPEQYYIQKPPPKPEISKTLIKDAIKAGQDCSEFAKIVQDTKLEIK